MAMLYCVQSLANDGSKNNDEQVKQIRAALNNGPQSNYRIFALRVGAASKARRNVFIVDPSLPRRIEVAFSFWVLKGNDRVILIDTGFTNRYMIKLWKIEEYKDPVEALSEIDLLPEQVTDVIVTHSHWDHIGGLSRFRKAQIWITKKELRSIRAGKNG
jgi:glyoxylase-like metal-dependent hydrolase (beta-lactamase superfamily II)